MPQTGKNEMSRNNDKNEMHDNDENKKSKLVKITPTKQTKPKEKTLTSNSFTITKRETRYMKRAAIKNGSVEVTTKNIKKPKEKDRQDMDRNPVFRCIG